MGLRPGGMNVILTGRGHCAARHPRVGLLCTRLLPLPILHVVHGQRAPGRRSALRPPELRAPNTHFLCASASIRYFLIATKLRLREWQTSGGSAGSQCLLLCPAVTRTFPGPVPHRGLAHTCRVRFLGAARPPARPPSALRWGGPEMSPGKQQHVLLPHGYGHIVGHRPVDPVHTETAQNKQLLERGDVSVIPQGEGELLQRIQVIPLGKQKTSLRPCSEMTQATPVT